LRTIESTRRKAKEREDPESSRQRTGATDRLLEDRFERAWKKKPRKKKRKAALEGRGGFRREPLPGAPRGTTAVAEERLGHEGSVRRNLNRYAQKAKTYSDKRSTIKSIISLPKFLRDECGAAGNQLGKKAHPEYLLEEAALRTLEKKNPRATPR